MHHRWDGIMQKVRRYNLTIEELSDQLLSSVIRWPGGSSRLDVIFDVYLQLSIKTAERTLRGSDIHFTTIVPGYKIQQWRQLLSCGINKMKLIQFIVEQWQELQRREQPGQKEIYVTSGERCIKITNSLVTDVASLQKLQIS